MKRIQPRSIAPGLFFFSRCCLFFFTVLSFLFTVLIFSRFLVIRRGRLPDQWAIFRIRLTRFLVLAMLVPSRFMSIRAFFTPFRFPFA